MTLPETNNAERLQAIAERQDALNRFDVMSSVDSAQGYPARQKLLKQAAREDVPWLLAQNTELREQRYATREVARRLIGEKDALKAENTDLRDALAALVDDEECVLDHDGNCQEHGVFDGEPCPNAAGRAVLDKWGEG